MIMLIMMVMMIVIAKTIIVKMMMVILLTSSPSCFLVSGDNDNAAIVGDGDNDIEDIDDGIGGYIAHQLSFLLLASGRGVCLVVELCQSWTSSLMGEQVALQMLRDCLVSKL